MGGKRLVGVAVRGLGVESIRIFTNAPLECKKPAFEHQNTSCLKRIRYLLYDIIR